MLSIAARSMPPCCSGGSSIPARTSRTWVTLFAGPLTSGRRRIRRAYSRLKERTNMTFDHHVLLWLLALPLISGAFVGALGPDRGRLVRWVSLGASLATLALALLLAGRFMSVEGHGTDLRPQPGKRAVLPTFQPE